MVSVLTNSALASLRPILAESFSRNSSGDSWLLRSSARFPGHPPLRSRPRGGHRGTAKNSELTIATRAALAVRHSLLLHLCAAQHTAMARLVVLTVPVPALVVSARLVGDDIAEKFELSRGKWSSVPDGRWCPLSMRLGRGPM